MYKNIGFIIPNLRNGGAERVLSTISLNLDRNINQKIYVWDKSNPSYEYNGEIISLDIKNSNNILCNIIVLIKRIIKMRKYKKENNIETSISFLEGPNIVNILSRRKEKVIVTVHRYNATEREGIYSYIMKTLVKVLYNKADKVIAVSEVIKEELINKYHINTEKIEVIYNPLDISYIEEKSAEKLNKYQDLFNENTIINVARLDKSKGQWHLIKAFSKVKKQIKDANLIILGVGEFEEKLKNLVKRLNLENDVHFLGYKKNPFKYIKNSKVLVLSSLYEGFVMCILEALSCETNVISVDCKSGPREILDFNNKKEIKDICYGEFGILTPNFEEEDITTEIDLEINKEEKIMADAIINLLKNKDLTMKYKSISKSRAKSFSVDNIMNIWNDII